MSRNADQILAESFLDVRAKLLEVAATLDRVDRAGKLDQEQEQQRGKILEAMQICMSDSANRAEQLQHLFSRPFDPQWRTEMKL
ncbi:hypothetical protein N9N28_14125 [Rubripirellula amarantea]|uniref:Uncharacterized protein n=1 Tax=Rubripirellula amarantea TaxID=2527999 RepID=A0A5C5WWH3_9BACT|nr:hypothetical protein [Rubripirellula amarantea]MDA8745766.1 hypothetical protein [Rubripirellula amarantea]TWT54559.1 hypothetical protein Pla22_22080 [Rubripirellula amarantea]